MSELVVSNAEETVTEEEQHRKLMLNKLKTMGAVGMGLPMMLPTPGQGKLRPTEIKEK